MARRNRGSVPAVTAARALAGLLALALVPIPLAGQEREPELLRGIQDSQVRLEQIREDRAHLQREMELLRERVRSASGELRNIEMQLSASRSVLAEIDFQIAAMNEQVRLATGSLLRTREDLRERHAVLSRRLRDIYKRGPLHTAEVLLGAESFSDLLNRYHYLQMIATYDRTLFESVRGLEEELVRHSRELEASLRELERLRAAQSGEVEELRDVEGEHARTLAQLQTSAEGGPDRLADAEADERVLTDLVTSTDRRRLENERRQAVVGEDAPRFSTLSVAELGSLDWPVEGELVYGFGVDEAPDGMLLRRSGMGIRVPAGTPVRAVRPGIVAVASPIEGFGPSVVLDHGAGYYTLYLHLEEIGVVEGRGVESGQVVGTAGAGSIGEGPGIEFQLRAPVDGAVPQPLDPLRWLRPLGEAR